MRRILDKGSKTREKLVLNACQVFAAEGFHATKIDRVAEVAGVAKGTLYQYFRSKNELYDACLDIVIVEFAALTENLKSLSTFEGVTNAREFRVRVVKMCKVFFDGFVKRSELMSLFQAATTNGEGYAYSERFRPFLGELRRALDTLIQNGKNRGWIRNPTSSRDLSMFVLAHFQGLFLINYQRQDAGLFRDLAPSFRVEDVVDFLMRALSFSET